MLRSMRSGSLGARRLAVASARPAGTVPARAAVPEPWFTWLTWFGGLVAALARWLAWPLTDMPALAAAVARAPRPLLTRRGECDDPHETNTDQLRPARGAGRDRRGRQAL